MYNNPSSNRLVSHSLTCCRLAATRLAVLMETKKSFMAVNTDSSSVVTYFTVYCIVTVLVLVVER